MCYCGTKSACLLWSTCCYLKNYSRKRLPPPLLLTVQHNKYFNLLIDLHNRQRRPRKAFLSITWNRIVIFSALAGSLQRFAASNLKKPTMNRTTIVIIMSNGSSIVKNNRCFIQHEIKRKTSRINIEKVSFVMVVVVVVEALFWLSSEWENLWFAEPSSIIFKYNIKSCCFIPRTTWFDDAKRTVQQLKSSFSLLSLELAICLRQSSQTSSSFSGREIENCADCSSM